MTSQGQPSLILAPARHTTVVTTTTTTTTTYPPIPLPPLAAPPSPKDPKQYPLLQAPIPRSLRQFPITFPGGSRAIFRDGSTPEEESDQWGEEPVSGQGWQMLKPNTIPPGKGKSKEEFVGFNDAVERFAVRKRPLSAADNIVTTTTVEESMMMMEGIEAAETPTRSPPPRKKARPADQHVSRSGNAPPSPLPSPQASPSSPILWAPNPPPIQPDIALTSLLTLPSLVSHFTSLPSQLQSHVLITLMRHSPLPVLRTLHSILTPTLARDFLTLLPPELTSQILAYLPPSSLFSASRVSRSWRALIDSDPSLWRSLLKRTGTWFGGSSEALFSSRVYNHRARHPPPPAQINLPLPHPYKLLFKSRHTVLTRWLHTSPKRLSFQAHGTSVVTCLLFSRKRIISASDDHSIHVYSPTTGQQMKLLEGHDGGVWALAVCSRRIRPHPRSQDVAPNYHDTLVSGSTDRTVRIWDLATGRNTHIFAGHTSTVRCLAIVRPTWVEMKDGRKERWPKKTLIVTGSRDHTLRVWRLPGRGDPEYRSSSAENGEMEEVQDDAADNPYHLKLLQGHTHAVRALAAHGRTLVSGSYDATVRVWDIITGECRWILTGHTAKVYSVVLDHIRNQCCSGSMDGTVRIWSLRNGQLLHTLTGHTSLVGLLSLSPTTLVSAAADSTLRIWDPNTGELLHTLAAHTGAITCFQHDEFKVLSGSDGTLKMWDTRDGTIIKDLLTGITGVWQVVFDERFCVAASNRQDQTYLDVWDFAGEGDDDADIEAARIGEEDEETDDEDDFSGMTPMDEWTEEDDGANLPDDMEGKEEDDHDSPTAGRAKFDLGPSSSPLGRRIASNTGSLGLGVGEGSRGAGRLPLPPTTNETPTRPRMRSGRAAGPRY